MHDSSFQEMLKYLNDQQGNHPALVYDADGKQSLSYSELYNLFQRRSVEIRETGFHSAGIICVCTPQAIIDIFASIDAGLQITLLDSNIQKEDLEAALKQTDCECVINEGHISPTPYLLPENGNGNMLFFTSGTASKSRAVVLSEKSILASARNGSKELLLKKEDNLLCLLPLSHVFGFVCSLLWGISNGCTVSLGRGARHYIDDCMYFRPTAVSLVPMLAEFLLSHHLLNQELNTVLIGAGTCKDEVFTELKKSINRVSFGYGMTETSSGTAISTGSDPRAMTVCQDVNVTIADDGEILEQCPKLIMKGYYKSPKETAEVLQDGILHTGDLGFLDSEGKLHITGRKKEILVLSDGTKIFLPEYEKNIHKLLGNHESALFIFQGNLTLVIADQLDHKQIMEALKPYMNTLPRGKQITRIISLNHPLPKTATGKIKRYEIEKEIK